MDRKEVLDKVIDLSFLSKYYEDLYDVLWKVYEGKKAYPSDYKNTHIGLFNVPCNGFGDIILCKTFYDYLKEWYPGINISICTTSPTKYNDLGIKGKIYTLTNKQKGGLTECINFDKLKFVGKNITFDIMIVVPIINQMFEIKQFRKLIPYAKISNTFTMSEYNGDFPPYTFPIGVGKENIGIMINNFKHKKQTLLKKPYALVYIAQGIGHDNYCFYSYLEMICKKYSKKHNTFQVVVPGWIGEDLMYYPPFIQKVKKILKPYYNTVILQAKDEPDIILFDSPVEHKDTTRSRTRSRVRARSRTRRVRSRRRQTKRGGGHHESSLIIRADILPQKRDVFISLMKDSVEDILVTGDQSITDVISCCRNHKQIWYQIAPWKKDFATNMFKELPNKYYKTFKTSCGTLSSVKLTIDWDSFIKDYDFSTRGKTRMDAILLSHKNSHKITEKISDIIETSRRIDTAIDKFKKLNTD